MAFAKITPKKLIVKESPYQLKNITNNCAGLRDVHVRYVVENVTMTNYFLHVLRLSTVRCHNTNYTIYVFK
jgi:hypothetical protein